jgi:hypothetical protein
MKQQERSQSVVALILGLVVVFVLIVTAISTLNRSGPNEPLSIQPTGIPTHIIEGSTLTPDMAGTQKAILGATWSAITRTPFPTQVPFPTGTREGEMVKFSAEKMFLDALNGWGGYLDGISVVIYAGSQPEDPEQGAIVILFNLPYRFFSEKVLTPTKHGGVRVVAEQNNRLTLLAADGENYYFDVPARRFVASLTEVVPTATPPPTYTPPVFVTDTPVPTYNPYPLPTEPGTETP